MDHWATAPDRDHPVRAEFASGGVEYTTLDHAADLCDFINRDKGLADLARGATLRTHMGTYLTVVTESELRLMDGNR